MMIKCQNCGKTIEVNIDVCPECGSYLYNDESIIDPEVGLEREVADEDILSTPGNYEEAIDNLPDDTYNSDELERIALEAEQRKFGKSSE